GRARGREVRAPVWGDCGTRDARPGAVRERPVTADRDARSRALAEARIEAVAGDTERPRGPVWRAHAWEPAQELRETARELAAGATLRVRGRLRGGGRAARGARRLRRRRPVGAADDEHRRAQSQRGERQRERDSGHWSCPRR